MSETSNTSELTPDQEKVFEDVRNNPKELFTKGTSFRSLPELVREWAVDSSWRERTGGDIHDDPFLIRVYYRTSSVIRYVHHILGRDTGNYKENPKDLPFHQNLIAISADIEEDWEEKHNDPQWKKEMLARIDERTKRYMEESSSTS